MPPKRCLVGEGLELHPESELGRPDDSRRPGWGRSRAAPTLGADAGLPWPSRATEAGTSAAPESLANGRAKRILLASGSAYSSASDR